MATMGDHAIVVGDRRDGHRRDDVGAILAHVLELAAPVLAGEHRLPHLTVDCCAVPAGAPEEGLAADDLLGLVPGCFEEARVDVLDRPLGIRDDDQVGALLDCAGELAELLFRSLALADVADDQGHDGLSGLDQLRKRRLDRKLLPAGAERQELVAAGRRRRVRRHQHRGDALVIGLGQARRPKDVERAADDLVRRVAEDPLGAAVEDGDPELVVDHHDAVAGNGEDLAVAFLHCPAIGLQLAPLVASLCLAQLAFDRRQEAAGLAFQDVVLRARFQCRDRHLLTDRAGDEDERHLARMLAHHRQSIGAVEARHAVVGDDNVPGVVGECGAKVVCGVDPAKVEMVVAALELADKEIGIVLRVLDDQELDRVVVVNHGRLRGAARIRAAR